MHQLRKRLVLGCLPFLVQIIFGIAAPSSHAADPQEHKYGKSLVVETRVSKDKIEAFNAFEPSEPVKGESAVVNSLLASTEDWVGETMSVSDTANPYTIVVTLEGVAREDGDVATLWQAGWSLETGTMNGTNRLQPLAGLSRSGVKAGELVSMTAGVATTFKQSREVTPVIGLVRADNIDIQNVRVQVWSGVGDPSPIEMLGVFRWIAVPVVMLVLWFFWLRRG